ncbi:MAG: 4Fe-4S binding protein [Ignavibacteria bacterium]|nr:4Fe-4S binding protein [Ignavibacteria bacterium]
MSLERARKIPPELRRRVTFSLEPVLYKRVLRRLKEDSQFVRSTVQAAFALLCIWIGIEFALFMQWGMSAGRASFFSRPPGAEGFLPISALISLKYWLQTGIINDVHPAALFILLAIMGVSVALKKSFCSWLCPVGTLSESLWLLGKKIFGRNILLPRWLDYPFRSLKYLLLVFFLWSIGNMDVLTLRQFIYSPYNKVADIKMYLFFAQITTVGLWTVVVLMVLSIFIRNFWCRFLCPYGALLGALSWLSPLKVTRTKGTCIDCELCTRACPSNIQVHMAKRVWSDECTSCMLCIDACPVKETLDLRGSTRSRPVPGWVLGTLVTGVFVAITGLAMLTGNWNNGISQGEYGHRFKELESPLYQHFHGTVPNYGPND